MFKAHGFCLLSHKTNVKNWNTDKANSDNEITNIYKTEIDELLKTGLYGDDSDHDKILEVIQPNQVLMRGRGTAVNAYAMGVHQDFGTNDTEFAN